MCRRKNSFKKYVVGLMCILGLYMVLSPILKSSKLHQQHSNMLLPVRERLVSASWNNVIKNPLSDVIKKISTSPEKLQVSPRVLLLYHRNSTNGAREISTLLQSHRIPYDPHLMRTGGTLQLMEERLGENVLGKYCLIICASIGLLESNITQGHVLAYSAMFNVTIMSIAASGVTPSSHKASHFHTVNIKSYNLQGVLLNPSKQFYYLKTGEWFTGLGGFTSPSWTAFTGLAHDEAEVLATVMFRGKSLNQTLPLAITLKGIGNSGSSGVSGVNQVLIGSPMAFWMTEMLVLEVIRSLYPGLARFGRERWIMIDIDDIFVAPAGLKMTSADVEALLHTQTILRQYVPGLTFNLGYCGYFFDKGLESEKNGSLSLVRNRDQFWWFGHIYNHYQPHAMSEQSLREEMLLNLAFARKYNIQSTKNSYSVSPHHSGVYPVYMPLYKAWVELLNVTMTTTEEYPHLYPSHKRLGYIYQGVMVLPRQTCRLFTRNYLFEEFGKNSAQGVAKSHMTHQGKEGLLGVAQGGEVFHTVLHNPVSIFMTHMTNYAKDRLSPFLFLHLFQFITRWTKLQLLTDRPLNLGKTYFSLFPEDKIPVWTSPCQDKRHMDVWPSGRNCTRLPKAVILGPQKSGSTALHMYMQQHPNISTSAQSAENYEEVQFFSDETLYMKGINWYMDQFPYPLHTRHILFEKSATYFTHPKAAERIFALLPQVKLIIILHNPVTRAYSWYQHMRAHQDITAISHSFLHVLTPQLNHTHLPGGHDKVRRLREHCLEPGRYSKYITHWLKYFPANLIMFVDSGVLITRPEKALHNVQKFLRVKTIDYGPLLSFSSKKGHYCLLKNGKQKCLGPSKGRVYPPLQSAELAYLEDYYHQDNVELGTLLKKLGRPFPIWLVQALG